MNDAPRQDDDARPNTPDSQPVVGPPPHPYSTQVSPQTPTRMSKGTVWIIAAVVAVLFTIAVIAFSVLRSQGGSAEAPADPAASAEQDEQAAPPAEAMGTVVWPQNMPGGAVTYAGSMQPVEVEAPADDTAPSVQAVDRDAGPADIQLYVDYRCPACSAFETANAATLEAAAKTGEATLEVRPLTFLDRANEQERYSSRAAAAQACVVDGQPELAWATHTQLLNPDFMPSGPGTEHTNEALADAFAKVGPSLSDDVRACIESETFVPFAGAMNQWVFSNPVPNAVDETLSVTSTPLIVVNGVPFEGAPDDVQAFTDFLEAQGVSLK